MKEKIDKELYANIISDLSLKACDCYMQAILESNKGRHEFSTEYQIKGNTYNSVVRKLTADSDKGTI